MSQEPDYLGQALAAAQILTDKWFPPSAPSDWVPNDFWRTPTICTMLVGLMEQTDQVDYTTTFENARKASESWLTRCGYYDDLTCWGRFFMQAYKYYESRAETALAEPYLADAKIVCDQLDQAWNDWDSSKWCRGGVWWKREPNPPYFSGNNFKASNSTLGFMEVALDLYLADRDQTYLDLGQKAWDWLAGYGFVADNGLVWGGLTLQCQLDPQNPPVVGLQGNPLGPLWSLYQATQDTQYLDVADRVVRGTMSLMVWEGTEILQASDDAEWAGQTDLWKLQNSGQTPFKGNFCNYLGNYMKNLAALSDPVRQQTAATYAAFLRANADAVWNNYPGAMFSMDWHTFDADYQPIPPIPGSNTNADEVNGSLQYSGVAVLSAAALVSG